MSTCRDLMPVPSARGVRWAPDGSSWRAWVSVARAAFTPRAACCCARDCCADARRRQLWGGHGSCCPRVA